MGQATPIGRFIYGDPRYARTPAFNPYAANVAAQSPSLLTRLKTCVKTLYGIDMKSIKFATKRRDGVFVGYGYDASHGTNREIEVTTNARTYDSGLLAAFYDSFQRRNPNWTPRDLRGKTGGLTLPGVMVTLGNGVGSAFTPYLNYVSNDLINDAWVQFTHIHELGHALALIRYGTPQSPEDGKMLTDCMKHSPPPLPAF